MDGHRSMYIIHTHSSSFTPFAPTASLAIPRLSQVYYPLQRSTKDLQRFFRTEATIRRLSGARSLYLGSRRQSRWLVGIHNVQDSSTIEYGSSGWWLVVPLARKPQGPRTTPDASDTYNTSSSNSSDAAHHVPLRTPAFQTRRPR
jgi:hypothetical protein